jgi:hypothetical protein
MKVIKIDGNYEVREIVLEIDIKESLASLMKSCTNHYVGLFEYLDKDRKKQIFVLRDKQKSQKLDRE